MNEISEISLLRSTDKLESLNVLYANNFRTCSLFTDYYKKNKTEKVLYKFENKEIMDVCSDVHVRRYEMGFFFAEKNLRTAIDNRLEDYGIIFVPICDVKKYLFINKKHPLAGSNEISVKDIQVLDLIKIKGADLIGNEKTSNHSIETSSIEEALKFVAVSSLGYIGFDLKDNDRDLSPYIRRYCLSEAFGTGEMGILKRKGIDYSREGKRLIDFLNNELKENSVSISKTETIKGKKVWKI